MKTILLIMTSFALSASIHAGKLSTSIKDFLHKRPEYKKLSDEPEKVFADYFIDSAYSKVSGNNSVVVLVRGKRIVGYFVTAYGSFNKEELLKILRKFYTEEQFDVKHGGSVNVPNAILPFNTFFFIDKQVYPLAEKEHQDEVIKKITP